MSKKTTTNDTTTDTDASAPRLVSPAEAAAIRSAESRPTVETAAEREQRRVNEWCQGGVQRLNDFERGMGELAERERARMKIR
jgi:hypothetical protein